MYFRGLVVFFTQNQEIHLYPKCPRHFKGIAPSDDANEQFISVHFEPEAQLRNATLASKQPKTLLSDKIISVWVMKSAVHAKDCILRVPNRK